METISLILLPVAVLMCAYALTVFIWRARAIAKKQVGAAACMSSSCSPNSFYEPRLTNAACLELCLARLLGRVTGPSACLSLLMHMRVLLPSTRQSTLLTTKQPAESLHMGGSNDSGCIPRAGSCGGSGADSYKGHVVTEWKRRRRWAISTTGLGRWDWPLR